MHDPGKVFTSLTIIRYPRRYVFFALIAMAVHRIPLFFNRQVLFWKLMGCGKGGSFSKTPDWQQWAVLTVRNNEPLPGTQQALLKMLYGKFIAGWYACWKCETTTFLLEPLSGHGAWDNKMPFGALPEKNVYAGKIAVITRATIRLTKLGRFWRHVKDTSDELSKADGLLYSISIGEIPFIKQATFSIWSSMEDMKAFAYQSRHKDIIQKTREEKWYREELFVRFRMIKAPEFRQAEFFTNM